MNDKEKIALAVKQINDNGGKFKAEEMGDSWFILNNDGQEIAQGYDYDMLARLQQIAKEDGVYLELEKLFSVRVTHTGSDPLGDLVPEDHAFFTGFLTCHEKGKTHKQLDAGEGGCIHRATTADGKYVEKGKTHHILYNVTRVQ